MCYTLGNDDISIVQTAKEAFGSLRVNVTSMAEMGAVPDARVRVTESGEDAPQDFVARTDISGQTEGIVLPAPPLELSLEPGDERPYSLYNVEVDALGYETFIIDDVQILPDVEAIQNISLLPESEEGTAEIFVIPPHTLFYDYPPKEPESEIKPVGESGEIVLSRVVIPEYVVVHDGVPTDRSAKDYYVPYKDYIKNVASSEIYATWPRESIIANVLAIQSFTLNRVYTEWYRNKGYDFTITSSTAYDHKWIPERNIFGSIASVVDQIFNEYLTRPNITQPILAQYCDGRSATCPGVMSQWGSKELGDDGFTAIEILRFYYGDNIFIDSTDIISGVPSSWPGYDLAIGSRGDKVRQLQNQLNGISEGYPIIPKVAVDGVYGNETANAVSRFQKIFGLGQTGVTDFPTWYKISEIYVGVSKIAEYR